MIMIDGSILSSPVARAHVIGYQRVLAKRRDPNEFIDLFSALKKRVTALVAEVYAEADLGATQAKSLRYIGKNSRCSQAELARAVESDPTLTGRVLQTLLERGLIKRERSDVDRREYVLELTAAGRRAWDRIGKARDRLAVYIGGALDDRDFDDFERVTKKLLAAFDVSSSPDS